MLGRLGPLEIMIIVGILVFLFGAKKIPELARGMGLGIKEFKKGLEEGESILKEAAEGTGETSGKAEDSNEKPEKKEENRQDGMPDIPEGFGN
ncbi:twin-arginine translocase TatA/TatE family subunit [Gemmatimonadota bacterium]